MPQVSMEITKDLILGFFGQNSCWNVKNWSENMLRMYLNSYYNSKSVKFAAENCLERPTF